jgi:outer membrane protein assembly factor BamB
MNPITLLVWGLGALILLGLFVAAAGGLGLARHGRSRRHGIYVAFGLLFLAVAGGWAWWKWPLIGLYFRGDLDDPARMAGARSGGLDTTAAVDPEWSQWRGPLRDGRSAETGLAPSWPKGGPKELWRTPIKGGYASLSVWKGRAYTQDREGSRERVVCLDADTGKLLWAHEYPVDYAGIDYGAGPRATPAVHDGRVYTVGATGVLLCLEAAPAGNRPKVLWEHDLLAEFDAKRPKWGVACSPLVAGDLVVVQPGGNKGSVAAFDRVTGKLAWTALDDPSGYSSPVFAAPAGVEQVIAFTARRIAGLRPADGKVLWDYTWATMYDANIPTPIVTRNYVFLSSDYSTGCALLQLTASGEDVSARPAFVRKDKLMRNQFSTCVLHDGHLYGFDVSGHGGTGLLKCVDLTGPKEVWSTRGLSKGCLIYADGRLIVQSQDGELALVEATPKGYVEKGRFQALQGGDCWAPPALSGGRLYLRDGHHVLCLDLRQ